MLAAGIAAEDQSAFRAEAEGLLAALRALCMAVQKIGTSKIQVVIVLDCRSVIEVAHGKLGTTPVLACRLQRALGEALRCFHQVTLTWVPSHGKGRSGWRPHEGLSEGELRAWSAAADRGARDEADRLRVGYDVLA